MTMPKKIYWQLPECDSVGWVYSLEECENLMHHGADIDIPKELFDRRVKEGCEVAGPEETYILNDKDRELCFNSIKELEFKLQSLASYYQNSGVCMKNNHEDMVKLSEQIKSQLDGTINLSSRVCRRVV
tara:strand:- start:20622 stop:21008 length:387 start_codon:yes stop_codon:yes gene_type:complete